MTNNREKQKVELKVGTKKQTKQKVTVGLGSGNKTSG